MIKYTTEIDSVSLQIDCKDRRQQRFRIDYIRRCIIPSGIAYLNFNNKIKKYEIHYAGTTFATLSSGYSNNTYYIRIRFAGLKSYKDIIDKKSKLCLMLLCGWLRVANIPFRLVELDIAIDMFCPFFNALATCTRKTSNVPYNELGKMQCFDGSATSYIEDYSESEEKKNATSRSYLYNKTSKDKLSFDVTRFELKLQNKYFKSFRFNTQSILNALSKYHVMYFSSLNQKEYIIGKYNSYFAVHRREIDRLGLDQYRLYPDAKVIAQFIDEVNSVYIDFEGKIAYHNQTENNFLQ